MQDQPIYTTNVIDAAYKRVDWLRTSLQFIDACFNFLPYQTQGPRSYSLTYYYADTLDFQNIEDIITALKNCITYQVESGREISIPAEINFNQNAIVDGMEIELFYYGNFILYDSVGRIFYRWYQSTPMVLIELVEPTSGETILSLFNNFQEAISDQITKANDRLHPFRSN